MTKAHIGTRSATGGTIRRGREKINPAPWGVE